MTNALDASVVMPSNPPIALRLLSNGKVLVIEAWDHSPLELHYHEVNDDDECGRGLGVVAALSQRWGVVRTGSHSKAVWAELVVPNTVVTEAGLPRRTPIRAELEHQPQRGIDPVLLRRVLAALQRL
jgi:hypothetical protein